MRKKTIAILFIIGIVVAIIGGVFFGVASASIATAGLATGATQDSVNAAVAAASGQILIGGIILAIGGICSTISWIGALVATARQGRWGWFVCVLLLTGLGELIYLIAGPGFRGNVAPAPQM